MSTWTRYLLLQVPSWVLATLLLYWLHDWIDLPLWARAAILGVYIGKDFVIYPLVYMAYESRTPTPGEELIGSTGITKQDLDPQGYIRVRNELWIGEILVGEPAIPSGHTVRVVALNGNTLTVELADDTLHN